MVLQRSSDPSVFAPPRLMFVDSKGVVLDCPREWEAATLILPWLQPEGWTGVAVEVNARLMSVHLERVAGAIRVAVPWPKAGAGLWQVVARVRSEEARFTVNIPSAKISESALATMLDDLETRLPASVAVGLDRLGAYAGLNWKPPTEVTLAQELEHVRRALMGNDEQPGLIALLLDIARQPHRVLATQEVWTRTELARRPIPSRIRAALERPGNVGKDRVPQRVFDGRVVPSFDVFENRLLREFRDQADRRLRILELAASRRSDGDTNLGLLRELRIRFRAACSAAEFLNDVGPLRKAPDRPTEVLLRRPPYRAVLATYLRFRRSARVQLQHPALDAPMQDVPTLYELWGTMLVITEILDVAALRGWHVTGQRLVTPGAVQPLVSVLAGGPILTIEGSGGRTATLYVQPGYGRGGSGLRSISFEQRPDLVLDVTGPRNRSLHIFDPKYKLAGDADAASAGGPAKADIDKMHAYRDAIRDSSGHRVVQSAAILYPGQDRPFGDRISAWSAVPGSERSEGLRDDLDYALAGEGSSDVGRPL
jgi:hypothetical protein